MGLDVTHDCWSGSYTSFHSWRCAIAKALDLPFVKDEPMDVWVLDQLPPDDPIRILMEHSDCDGEISWEDCAKLADRLEGITPILRDVHHRTAAHRFVRGLRRAFRTKENVEFH